MPEEFKWDIDWKEFLDEVPSTPRHSPPTQQPASIAQSEPPPVGKHDNLSATPGHPLQQPTLLQRNPNPPQTVQTVDVKLLVRGQRITLADIDCSDLNFDFVFKFEKSGASIGCLGLSEENRFVGDNYFASRKQPATPCGSCRVVETNGDTIVRFDLNRAPAAMHRVSVIAFTDTQTGLSSFGNGTMLIRRGMDLVATGAIAASDLGSCPCSYVAEIYRRGGCWRLGVLFAAQSGSLQMLLRSHGATI